MTEISDRLAPLADALTRRLADSPIALDRPVRLLLDTDSEIGREEGTPERRVGFTPAQGKLLVETAAAAGLPIEWAVIEGAGERAGCSDDDYRAAGARVMSIEEVAAGGFEADVVHALKEPAPHEATFPGPYSRIGAAHIEVSPPGLVAMIRQRNVGIVFCGRTIGGHANLIAGGDRFPIVASMSRFAGRRSGEQVRDRVEVSAPEHQRCIVVGAGVAGVAAASVLLECQQNCAEPLGEVIFVDVSRNTLGNAMREIRRTFDWDRIRVSDFLAGGDRMLRPSDFGDGLPVHSMVFAAAGRNRAPRVLAIDSLIDYFLVEGGMAADIGIDQGGCIAFSGDGLSPKEQIQALTERFEYQKRLYFGEVNMPRYHPDAASESHGAAVLPYLLSLCALHRLHGSPADVARELQSLPRFGADDTSGLDLFDHFKYDLGAGIQMLAAPETGAITVPPEHRGNWFVAGNGIFDSAAALNADVNAEPTA